MKDPLFHLKKVLDDREKRNHIENVKIKDQGKRVSISFYRTEKSVKEDRPIHRRPIVVYNILTDEKLVFPTSRKVCDYFTEKFGFVITNTNVKYSKEYPAVPLAKGRPWFIEHKDVE